MLPAQRAERQKGRVSMSTGNLALTKTIRSSHANHEASSIDIVQQQRKFGKVILRQRQYDGTGAALGLGHVSPVA